MQLVASQVGLCCMASIICRQDGSVLQQYNAKIASLFEKGRWSSDANYVQWYRHLLLLLLPRNICSWLTVSVKWRRSFISASYSTITERSALTHLLPCAPQQISKLSSRSVRTVQCAPTLNIYTGFIPTQLMTNTSGCCYSLWCSWWWTQRASETCRAYL